MHWREVSAIIANVGKLLFVMAVGFAVVAELADALDSGSSEGNFMEVQVLSTAPTLQFHAVVAEWQTRQLEGLVGATLWRFESSLPHQFISNKPSGISRRLFSLSPSKGGLLYNERNC